MNTRNTVVVLNNIRSNENVGSIFRTCDAAGVSKIFLCGYTPAPVDRFGRENKKLTKASLGAEKFVKWEKNESLKEAITSLKNSSFSLSTDISLLGNSSARLVSLRKARSDENFSAFTIVAVEQDKRAIDYKNWQLTPDTSHLVFVFGNEVSGLSQADLKLCDQIIEIPMRGRKESLNVAVAVGVVLFSIQ